MVEQVQTSSTQLRKDTEYEFNKLKSEIEKCFELAKAHIDGQGQSGGFGKGSPHGGHKGIDKKEITVGNLLEELDKSSLRNWVDAVDLQLDMVHGFKQAGFVLYQIRRSKVAIDKPVFEPLLSTASVDIRKSQVELGISPDAPLSEEFDYLFHQRTTFLNAYLISKLNTSLHDQAVGIEHHDGIEIYKQFCQHIDAVREDVHFHMEMS